MRVTKTKTRKLRVKSLCHPGCQNRRYFAKPACYHAVAMGMSDIKDEANLTPLTTFLVKTNFTTVKHNLQRFQAFQSKKHSRLDFSQFVLCHIALLKQGTTVLTFCLNQSINQ